MLTLLDEQLINMLIDLIVMKEDKGLSPNYINSTIKAVKSWLYFNGRKLIRILKIKTWESIPSMEM